MPAGARVLIDAYAILGVAPSAALADVKRAYKRLARQFHPDVNHDPGAEDRFKEVSAAYDLLKDDDRRATYDKRRGGATRPAPAARPPPAAKPPVARPPPAARPPPPEQKRSAPPPPAPKPPPPEPPPVEDRKADVFVKVALTYAEVIKGEVKEVHFRRQQPCTACDGATPADVPPAQRKPACRACWGAGWQDIPSIYRWTIPPGVEAGTEVVIPGLGDRMASGRTGSLRLSVAFMKTLGVTRDGFDFQVLKRVHRTVLEAGGRVEVEGPAGLLTVDVPPGSKAGVVVRIPNAGLPQGSRRGSVFVTVREFLR